MFGAGGAFCRPRWRDCRHETHRAGRETPGCPPAPDPALSPRSLTPSLSVSLSVMQMNRGSLAVMPGTVARSRAWTAGKAKRKPRRTAPSQSPAWQRRTRRRQRRHTSRRSHSLTGVPDRSIHPFSPSLRHGIVRECSVGSRLRSLRSPLRGLDPTCALPSAEAIIGASASGTAASWPLVRESGRRCSLNRRPQRLLLTSEGAVGS